MEDGQRSPEIAEIPAQDVVIHERSWIIATLYSFLVLSCLVLAYLNVDRIFSLAFLTGPPSYPNYPGWQNVERRTERQGNQRFGITTFETADDSGQVAEFYNAHFRREESWYPRYDADYSNPIEWWYEDYCPLTEVHVQRTALPTGKTRVEVRVIEASCFAQGK
jgi:hypothetical protein